MLTIECKFNKEVLTKKNHLLAMQDSFIIQFRGRLKDFENKRQKTFKTSILKKSFQFERVETTTTNEKISSKIQNVLHRVDSALDKERKRDLDRERG